MRKIIFATSAINDMQRFKSGNQNVVFKILELITAIQSDPFKGIGKPEPLKGDYHGAWSRRINDEHRIIYRVTADFIEIESCHGHYGQEK
jgi:toxin YoeB